MPFEKRRAAFLERAEKRMAELDSEIGRLKDDAADRSRELSAEGKEGLDRAIMTLEKRRAETRQLMTEASQATSERWEYVKGSTSNALQSVADATADAWKRLRR
jgi:hypothetical protein